MAIHRRDAGGSIVPGKRKTLVGIHHALSSYRATHDMIRITTGTSVGFRATAPNSPMISMTTELTRRLPAKAAVQPGTVALTTPKDSLISDMSFGDTSLVPRSNLIDCPETRCGITTLRKQGTRRLAPMRPASLRGTSRELRRHRPRYLSRAFRALAPIEIAPPLIGFQRPAEF
jgi:hypothetical protein